MLSKFHPKHYKKWIWAYILLFIFEGAIRKWLFPGLSSMFLLVREPIVLYLFFIFLKENVIKTPEVKALMIIGTICWLTALVFGHQNLFIATYGWHIYFLHFPFILIASKIINQQDVLKIGRVLLYISIPMTILIITQFYSPQTAWVNRGVGGDMDGAGFGGAMVKGISYYRPSGTFSFTSGYTSFQQIVCSFLFYYMVANKTLPWRLQIKQWHLYGIMLCYILSIPYSISRSLMFMTIITAIFTIVFLLSGTSKHVKSLLYSLIGFGIVLIIASQFNLLGEGMNVFAKRFEDASTVEGGLEGTVYDRYIGGFFNSLLMNVPFFGYGLGIGTNAGASLIKGDMFSIFNAESGFGLIIGECGLILGAMIVFCRLSWTYKLVELGYKLRHRNSLAILLMPNMLILLSTGAIGSFPALGALVTATFLYIASFNKIRLYTKSASKK